MLDKSVKYHRIFMKRPAGAPLKEFYLPEGFKFTYFKKGDEKLWAGIETSVMEFNSKNDACKYFEKKYLPFLSELERRCIFVQDDKGNKIATLSIWWEGTGKCRSCWLHWFAVKPGFQGKGIGNALLYKAMKEMILIEGDVDVYLKTQTWSHRAINLYKRQSFEIATEEKVGPFENNEYQLALAVIKNLLY